MKIKEFKKINIVSICVVIIFIIINLLFLKTSKTLWLKNKKIKSEINKKMEELAKGSNISSVKESLNSEINQLGSKLSFLEENFFSKAEEIFLYINRSAEAAKISLKGIEPKEKVQRPIPNTKDTYLELPINIKIKCDYHQLLVFLDKIEAKNKSILVSEIKIQSDPKDIYNHDIEILFKVPVLFSQETP